MEPFPGTGLSGFITRVTVGLTFLWFVFLIFPSFPTFSDFLSFFSFLSVSSLNSTLPRASVLQVASHWARHMSITSMWWEAGPGCTQDAVGAWGFWVIPVPEFLPCGLQKPLNSPWNHHTLVSKWHLPTLTSHLKETIIHLLDSGLVFWFIKCVPVIGEFKVSPGRFGIQDVAEFGNKAW